MKGKYIVIEGADGTGKSTQLALLAEHLASKNIEYVEFSEPDGTPISNEIRAIIKNGSLEREAETNLLLFTAARHEIWKHVALPALEQDKCVIASRNYYSTLVYQGYAEGLSLKSIETITREFTGDRYVNPDISMILSLPEHSTRMKRINHRGTLKNVDTFENKGVEFQDKLHSGYLSLAKSKNIPVIDANQSIDAVFLEILSKIHT